MLEYAALALLITMVTFIIYLIIYIHDIPYEIAKERGHPHRDAIHIAGWVSMFTLHSIWPFLWIWAYLYTPGEKFMHFEVEGATSADDAEKITRLEGQVMAMQTALDNLQATAREQASVQESISGENKHG